MDRPQPALVEHGGHFGPHVETEIFQCWHAFGQRQAAFRLVELEPQAPLYLAVAEIHPRAAHHFLAFKARTEFVQARDVERRLARAIAAAESGGEMVGEAHGEARRAARLLDRAKLGLDRFAPAAQQRLHLLLELRLVGRLVAIANVENEADGGEIAAFDLEAPVEQPRRGGFLEQRLDFQPHLCRDHVARQPDESEEVAGQRRLDQREARAWAIDQAHHRRRDAFDVFFREADQ